MSKEQELQVTGYRGIWGENLTEDIVRKYTKAFALFIKEDVKKDSPTILIGRDGRENGLDIKKIIIDNLKPLGINIIDGDILPTPTVLFAVRKHNYDGAIIITASHNPIEYNGLKFVTQNARLTNENEVAIIKKYYDHS
jgi:phosphomannomutase